MTINTAAFHRAEQTLLYYQEDVQWELDHGSGDLRGEMTDLAFHFLADMHHWADRHNLDLREIFEDAASKYREED